MSICLLLSPWFPVLEFFCHQGCYPELIVRRLVRRFGAGER
ncbi:MAG: hypothetical protein V8K32_15310 [Candidatus Electrothrix gigas]